MGYNIRGKQRAGDGEEQRRREEGREERRREERERVFY